MKHENLQILSENGFSVPKFIVVSNSRAVDLSFSDSAVFAVRSSFGMEDGGEDSFAGQFDTFLHVPRAEVPKAVDKVLESGKKENVSAYLEARGLSKEGSMAVIVQEMVEAQYSGVIFTANPMGILNEMVIVVGEGLGSEVVADRIYTTTYYYNWDDCIYACHQQENAPLLEDPLLRELIHGAERIRDLFQGEMDIEFAIRDGKIFYLQTRPITTLVTEDPIILDNSNIVESYPGICLPLTRDFVKAIYYGIFRSCVLRISGNRELTDRIDPKLRDMTDSANWRIYYRISNWYAVLKMLPFSKKLIPIWQNSLGIANRAVSIPDNLSPGFVDKCRIFWRFILHLLRTPKLMEGLNYRFAESYSIYRQQIEDSNTPEELLRLYDHIRDSILQDWDITLINDMYTFIATALAGKRNSSKIANVKNLESMKPSLAMEALVETARHHGVCSNLYRTQANEYVETYGDRCLGELKLETRTYRTNPELLDATVEKRLAEQGGQMASQENVKKSRGLFVNMAKTGIRNREVSRLNRSRIFGLSRAIFLKIGAYYVEKGQLDNPEDIFYLRMEELLGEYRRKELVLSRKEEQLQYEHVPAYSRLVFAEKILNRPSFGIQGRLLARTDIMTGIGTSPGRIKGRVLVVHEPDDQIDTTGKILVTHSTDPGWVFLLRRAKGIIAEKGSLLSHTAIISRELGKPAVVHVKDCTRLLHTGDLVELDGEEGCIVVIERCMDNEDL